MPAFEVTLQSSEPVAESTMAFHLDKPEGFRFKPGQSIDLKGSGDFFFVLCY